MKFTRRDFVKTIGAASVGFAAVPYISLGQTMPQAAAVPFGNLDFNVPRFGLGGQGGIAAFNLGVISEGILDVGDLKMVDDVAIVQVEVERISSQQGLENGFRLLVSFGLLQARDPFLRILGQRLAPKQVNAHQDIKDA